MVFPGGAQGFDDGFRLKLAFVVLRLEFNDDVGIGEARKGGLRDVERTFDLNSKSVLVDALHFDWFNLQMVVLEKGKTQNWLVCFFPKMTTPVLHAKVGR